MRKIIHLTIIRRCSNNIFSRPTGQLLIFFYAYQYQSAFTIFSGFLIVILSEIHPYRAETFFRFQLDKVLNRNGEAIYKGRNAFFTIGAGFIKRSNKISPVGGDINGLFQGNFILVFLGRVIFLFHR